MEGEVSDASFNVDPYQARTFLKTDLENPSKEQKLQKHTVGIENFACQDARLTYKYH